MTLYIVGLRRQRQIKNDNLASPTLARHVHLPPLEGDFLAPQREEAIHGRTNDHDSTAETDRLAVDG
jgi:hypothetical protein